MQRPTIEFWYDFASTYSWLAAVRIEDLATAASCAVIWRPFLLGPIFKSQGWNTSPFNLYPTKGRYMVRDIERIAAARGRTLLMPKSFPANSLAAARLALTVGPAAIAAFSRGVFTAEFEAGADIAQRSTLEPILERLGRNAAEDFVAAESAEIKQALRDNTERAGALGLFGAPTLVSGDGEVFWGDDRLEQAIAWAVRNAAPV